MKKQRVIRTYPKGYPHQTTHLEEVLDAEWIVVMANNFDCGGEKGIEYIVEKEIDETNLHSNNRMKIDG